jgi:di/tricarboxylate transporter
MSAFMNNIGATAILLPAMFAIAKKADYPVGRLLIPLAFGSLLGGLGTLIGTPPNLLVSIALEEAGFRPFRMFDFLPTGLAVMAAGALYMATLGRRLIPRAARPRA